MCKKNPSFGCIQETNNQIKKWSTELNRILNRGISSDEEVLKEMFNILSHQGYTNQNNPEIPPYTNQNG